MLLDSWCSFIFMFNDIEVKYSNHCIRALFCLISSLPYLLCICSSTFLSSSCFSNWGTFHFSCPISHYNLYSRSLCHKSFHSSNLFFFQKELLILFLKRFCFVLQFLYKTVCIHLYSCFASRGAHTPFCCALIRISNYHHMVWFGHPHVRECLHMAFWLCQISS